MADEKILELIRKCLALASSPNENEAAAALAKAQDLLDKYNLEMADVSVQQDAASEIFRSKIEYGYEWRRQLYQGVAKQNFCVIVGIIGTKNLKIFGRLPNVIAVYEMAEWLSNQIERLSDTAVNSYNGLYFNSFGKLVRGDSVRQFRVDFLFGAVQRVICRLGELNEERRSTTPNISVLAIRLREEAREALNKEHPLRQRHSVVIRCCSDGYAQGVNAGDKVGIVPPSKHISRDNGLYLAGGK